MIGCLLAEGGWCRERGVGAGVGRRGNSGKLLGLNSERAILGICGGT